MLNVLAVILVFGGIVLIHEFGHFLFAKLNGIGVVEFAIGMGPTLLSIKKGETKYSIKLFPIGGFCMMVGEDQNDQSENSFQTKSVWARISVVIAGPLFNFLLAFVLAMVIVANVGYDSAQLVGVTEGFSAAEQGMQAGDTLTKINGHSIKIYRDVTMYLYFHPQDELEVEYLRDGETHTAHLVPKYSEDTGSYRIGIVVSGQRVPTKNFLEVMQYGAYEVRFWITNVVQSLGYALRGQVSSDEIGGPVRIVGMIGSTVEQTKDYGMAVLLLNLANISVLLSANLGVMNLLPIPALDGGRLLFMLVEAVRGKPISAEKEGMVHLAGFAILMVLMVFLLFNDIRNIF
ncbi:MAG: RIP metalloprotease RseP [bacterium]|nr:RIP metalloprotease RseP [bacterium]